VTRLIVVASAAIGIILFVAFVVSRLIRTRTRGMSIRMQVFLALAVIVGTFAFGLGLMVLDRVEARAVRLADQAARDEAATLAGVLAGEMDRTGITVNEIALRLEQEARRGADLRLELLDPGGHALFPAARPASPPEPGTISAQSPIEVRGKSVGWVRVVRPTVVMGMLLADFAPTVLVICLVLGAAAALAAGWIGAAIARPIEALTAFAERVSAGERTAAPPAALGREVTRLTGSIDSMRRQLEGRPFVETFAADLSHELKNPVAAIRASAEVLEEGALEEPEKARHFVARIVEASQRIERLLGDILSLARIDARGVETFKTVDVAALAEQAVSTVGDEHGRIQIRSEGDARVHGHAVWLGRALGNLMGNALVHGDPSGPIRVLVRRDGPNVVISVESPGAIQKHVRKSLFRRFVTTRSDKGGSGLGLAIVRAVAEAHGGQAEVVREGPPQVVLRMQLCASFRPAGADGEDQTEPT
jgi:two-component system, OmpR family, sensor histidine kinase CreC